MTMDENKEGGSNANENTVKSVETQAPGTFENSAIEQTNSGEAAVTQPEAEKQEANPLIKKLSISVPFEKIEKNIDLLAEKYSDELRLPGFRKGKVPVDIIKQRYKKMLSDESLENLAQDFVFEKIKEEKLEVIAPPIMETMNYNEGEALTADFSVEIAPQVLFPDLSTLELQIEKKELEMPEYNEETEINNILEKNKHLVADSESEINKDHYVQISYQAKLLDNKRLTPKKELTVMMAHENPQYEILDLLPELLGKKINDQLVFNRTYSADYHKKLWAGKEIEFSVTVKAIQKYAKPELDQEFLARIGFKDIESFKQKLKEEYEHSRETKKENYLHQRLLDFIESKVDFPIPQSLLEQEAYRLANQFNRFMGSLQTEQQQQIAESVFQMARKNIKSYFVMENLKKQHSIAVSNNEIEDVYKEVAEKNHVPLADVRKYYSQENRRDEIKDNLLKNKVVKFLKENITIKEV